MVGEGVKVYRELVKAVKKHIGNEDHKTHFTHFIKQEFTNHNNECRTVERFGENPDGIPLLQSLYADTNYLPFINHKRMDLQSTCRIQMIFVR
ncbi:hypothetical protein Leryth_024202 [Lithospermum erythrorhizon]|nr:hypothetical protein Leryth_024202 [Lithospermum erythrorhizon]